MLRRSTRQRQLKLSDDEMKSKVLPKEKTKKRKLSKVSSEEDDDNKDLLKTLKKESESPDIDDNYHSEDGEEFDLSEYKPSEYELLRQKNMQENLQLFDELNVKEAKQSLMPTKIYTRPYKKKPKIELPRRASLRIQNIKPVDYSFKDIPVVTSFYSAHDYRERKPQKISIKEECDENEKITLGDLSNLQHIEQKEEIEPVSVDLKKFKQKMKSLEVHYVAKIIPTRITSITVHPIETKLLCFVSDKRGNLSLWDLDFAEKENHGIAQFEPHSSSINRMKFSEKDTNKLYSCSYDGTFRCFDLNNLTFTQVYGVAEDDDIRFNYFANRKSDHSVYYTATSIGDIFQLDSRTGNLENFFHLYPKSIRCVDFHPRNENLFVAACTNGTLSTWDVRNLKQGKNNSISECRLSRTISGSFFSPQSGNKVLTTSQDDYIRLFDVNDNGKLTMKHQIRHDNYVTRWLTPFQACWIPTTDNCFVSGSMARPTRQVDIFGCGENQEICSFAIRHPEYTTVTSRNVFHPTRDVFFSGNSSGKVLVWM